MVETIIILLMVGVAGGVFYWMNRGSGRKPQHPASAQRHPKPAIKKKRARTKAELLNQLKQDKHIWGVEIKTPGCLEAYKLSRVHYPIDSAPVLPLPGCPASNCTCTYNGLIEHRSGHQRVHGERRNEVRFDPEHPDRRSHKDRRRNMDTWKDRDF